MRKTQGLLALTSVLTLAACSNSNNQHLTSPGTSPGASVPASVQVTQSDFNIATFAQGPSGSTKPDSIVQLGNNVFVAYQDNVNPDGTDPAGATGPAQNQIVEYDLNGKALKTFNVPGHNDGLLAFDSHTLWAMSNEDANPELTIIDLTASSQLSYMATVNPTAHGGGYDDMVMINGTVYVTASNPTLDAAGLNTSQAMVKLSLNSNGMSFDVTPVLAGNAQATDIQSKAAITLNLTDPDSEAVDPSNNLVVDSQGDSELVFVKNPGASQLVSRLPLTLYGNSWPVDDTRFVPTGKSFMLVTDTSADAIYRVDASGGFKPGDAYSAGQGTLLKLDPATGVLTPSIIGLNAPHGIMFVTTP